MPAPAPPPEADDHDDASDEPELELSAEVVARRRADPAHPVTLLDIREPHELRQGLVDGALVVPMNDIPGLLHRLPTDHTLAVYCAAGMRSFGVAHYLREQGFADAWSVPEGAGGLAAAGLGWVHPPRIARLSPGLRVSLPAGGDGLVQATRETEDGIEVAVLPLDPGRPAQVLWIRADDLS